MQLSLSILILAYGIALAIWGWQDKKEFKVSVYLALVLSGVYLIAYVLAFITDPYAFAAFLGIGLLISFGIWIALRKQIAPMDHYAILIGNIAFPYLAIPAFVISFIFMKLLLATKRAEGHAYLWMYFLAFVLVAGFYIILQFD